MGNLKKSICFLIMVSMCVCTLWHVSDNWNVGKYEVDASVLNSVNVGIDLTSFENRFDCKHDTFKNWGINELAPGTSVSYEAEGLTFTVTNESVSGTVYGNVNRELVSESGTSPVLTLDGLRYSSFKDGLIKLEIRGLPEGIHTFTSWHSFWYLSSDKAPRGTMTVTVNDKDIVTGLEVPVKVLNDNDAAIAYGEFEAKDGEPVVIYFKSDGNGNTNNIPILNGFEIDGTHPLYSISNPVPEDCDTHYEPENDLSWVAAEGAVKHRVYLGDDKFAVEIATKESPEFKGELSETVYYLDDYEFDNMKTYYWRVDEVFADGTVVEGRIYSFEVAHLAFPTAEGYGRYAKGGRGGRIIEVTTLEDGYETVLDDNGNPVMTLVLDDSGNPIYDDNGELQYIVQKRPIKGSLRYALEYEMGPRIVVFKVGGVIDLKEKLIIESEHDNVYVAGQTAPGDGITLLNYTFGTMGASDVIIRDVRVRIGDKFENAMSGMSLSGSDHCIIDHCSISWASDEGFGSRRAKNITFQWNIIAESLNKSFHYEGSSNGFIDEIDSWSRGGSISGEMGSFHHNLLVHNAGRNLSIAGGVGSDGKTYDGYVDLRNNIVYNWKDSTVEGGVRQINMVNNYYKFGPSSARTHLIKFEDNFIDVDTMYGYVSGNIMTNSDGSYDLAPTDDAWEAGKAVLNEHSAKSDVELFPSYVNTETAEESFESVLANVGANYPKLDYLDSRYIYETENGTYTHKGSIGSLQGIIDSQEDVGGYPNESNFKGGEAPADTDHDGMPDEWEIKHGLDPENYYDASAIYLSDEGYTNIELYLNELMGDPVVYSENPTIQYTPAIEDDKPTAIPKETEIPNTTESLYLPGDVDDNGKVDAVDALRVLEHAARISLLDDTQKLVGDVTKDTKADAQDALQILRYAAKIIDKF